MKIFIAIVILLCNAGCSSSQSAKKKKTDPLVSDPSTINIEPAVSDSNMGIFFSSIASGPAHDDFLHQWLNAYLQKNKLSLTATKYQGCGKEGEYIIVLSTTALSKHQHQQLKTDLEKCIQQQVEENKSKQPDAGPIHMEYNIGKDSYNHCRLGGSKWL